VQAHEQRDAVGARCADLLHRALSEKLREVAAVTDGALPSSSHTITRECGLMAEVIGAAGRDAVETLIAALERNPGRMYARHG
jgi:hypothetical protein